MSEVNTEEKPQCWLILTWTIQQMQTPQGIQPMPSKVVSWDYATKTQMETFWKQQLSIGTHYLIPLNDAVVIENIIKAEPMVQVN